ncbi:MAG: ImmA/IrrE family metallo-endopeptidase [Hoeflea sp.]|uniref:ImmA/IrrE family metallo-endopeptidase n=1 Tax=Hoeflea sp. TaxID=1940281 RepID=UPI0032ED25F6
MQIPEYRMRQIKETSETVRSRLKLGDVCFVDFFNVVFPRLRSIFPTFQIVRLPDSAMPNAEAFADTECKHISIRESIWQALVNGDPRARFTVAHEIGHLFLGHTAYTARSNDPSMYRDPFTKTQESEANAFASLFLMPTDLAEKFNTADDIQNNFGVSRHSAAIRIEELDREKRKKAGQKRKLPQNAVDFLSEAKKRGIPIKSDLSSE